MLTFINNIPIFRRLFLAFALAALIPGIVIFVLGALFINTLTDRSEAVQTDIRAIHAATSAGAYLPHMDTLRRALINQPPTNVREFVVMPGTFNGHFYNDIKNLEERFDQEAGQFQQNYQVATVPGMSSVKAILHTDDPDGQLARRQQAALTAVNNSLWPTYRQQQDQVLDEIKAGQPISLAQQQALQTSYTQLSNQWTAVVSLTEQISTIVAQTGPSQINSITLSMIIAFLGIIMAVVIIGYIVNLTITRPLSRLATLTRRIAKGETSARAAIKGRDEIYMVATSMNNMLDNIVRLIQDTQSQRDSLQTQVEKLVSEVSGAGEGDLRVQAEVTANTLGVLADSFNYMVEELGSLVVRVKVVAGEVEKFTTMTMDRMTELVESGDRQIKQITEASREVEGTAASSHLVAERSHTLYQVAREARVSAQDGREALEQAVEGMGRISENVQMTAHNVQTLGERSRQINEIVDTIAGIAHQTNRLALDAAIQAAMAGENGKGFGAVAADIRRLAEKAKQQTGTIAQIVRSVREDIGAVAVSMQDTEHETSVGTELTQEAGIALESLFTAVEHQAREIEHINQMATQQLQSSSAVVQIMLDVSATTVQNGASTREASQNMERLARLVEQLRASVEAFKLRDNQSYLLSNFSDSMEAIREDLTASSILRTISATASPGPRSLNISRRPVAHR